MTPDTPESKLITEEAIQDYMADNDVSREEAIEALNQGEEPEVNVTLEEPEAGELPDTEELPEAGEEPKEPANE